MGGKTGNPASPGLIFVPCNSTTADPRVGRFRRTCAGGRLPERAESLGIDEILDGGLRDWLTGFIPLVRELGNAIHSSYLEVT
ncbi:protein of unknown function [Pseudomonas mediterranea]